MTRAQAEAGAARLQELEKKARQRAWGARLILRLKCLWSGCWLYLVVWLDAGEDLKSDLLGSNHGMNISMSPAPLMQASRALTVTKWADPLPAGRIVERMPLNLNRASLPIDGSLESPKRKHDVGSLLPRPGFFERCRNHRSFGALKP